MLQLSFFEDTRVADLSAGGLSTPPLNSRRFLWISREPGTYANTSDAVRVLSICLDENGEITAHSESIISPRLGIYTPQFTYIGDNCWVMSSGSIYSNDPYNYKAIFNIVTEINILRVEDDASVTIVDQEWVPNNFWYYHPHSQKMRSMFRSGYGYPQNIGHREISISPTGIGTLVDNTPTDPDLTPLRWLMFSDLPGGEAFGSGVADPGTSGNYSNMYTQKFEDVLPTLVHSSADQTVANPIVSVRSLGYNQYIGNNTYAYSDGSQWRIWNASDPLGTTTIVPSPSFPAEPLISSDQTPPPGSSTYSVWQGSHGPMSVRSTSRVILRDDIPNTLPAIWEEAYKVDFPVYSEFVDIVNTYYPTEQDFIDAYAASVQYQQLGTVAAFYMSDRTVYGESALEYYDNRPTMLMKFNENLWYTIDFGGRVLKWSFRDVEGWTPAYTWTQGENNQ